MKFLKEGFDVFVLESFEDKSGCRILDLLEFIKMNLENVLEENYSSQVVCYAQIFCLQGKQNISVSYVNGGWVRVWERGYVRDNEQTLCFIIIQLEFVSCHPCLYI